jgi:hypothetical protein
VATVKQYVQQLAQRQAVIAGKLGSAIDRADKPTRVQNLALLSLLAVVIKTLVDQGVITDAQLIATLNSARDDPQDDVPVDPPTP